MTTANTVSSPCSAERPNKNDAMPNTPPVSSGGVSSGKRCILSRSLHVYSVSFPLSTLTAACSSGNQSLLDLCSLQARQTRWGRRRGVHAAFGAIGQRDIRGFYLMSLQEAYIFHSEHGFVRQVERFRGQDTIRYRRPEITNDLRPVVCSSKNGIKISGTFSVKCYSFISN